MDNKERWIKEQNIADLRNLSRRMFSKMHIPLVDTYKKVSCIGKKSILNSYDTNKRIAEAIQSGRPYWAGRYGGTELNMITSVLEHRYRPQRDSRKNALNQLCHYSGFFPDDLSLAEQFVDRMLTDCTILDLHAHWSLYMEPFVIDTCEKNVELTRLGSLEPWGEMYRQPPEKQIFWTNALADKKVLVVHPFEETIREQYLINRDKLFSKAYPDMNVLPKFELQTLKAVQTLGRNKDSRFGTWFDALAWMEEECSKKDFEVAIIGCGAYGFPLAASIKRMGKVAIHLGGATQILFGILGRRWEENKDFMDNVVNEYWTHPFEVNRISNSMEIEGGCYW